MSGGVAKLEGFNCYRGCYLCDRTTVERFMQKKGNFWICDPCAHKYEVLRTEEKLQQESVNHTIAQIGINALNPDEEQLLYWANLIDGANFASN